MATQRLRVQGRQGQGQHQRGRRPPALQLRLLQPLPSAFLPFMLALGVTCAIPRTAALSPGKKRDPYANMAGRYSTSHIIRAVGPQISMAAAVKRRVRP